MEEDEIANFPMMGATGLAIVEDSMATMEDIFEDLHPNKQAWPPLVLLVGGGGELSQRQLPSRKSSWMEAKRRRHTLRVAFPRNILLPPW